MSTRLLFLLLVDALLTTVVIADVRDVCILTIIHDMLVIIDFNLY